MTLDPAPSHCAPMRGRFADGEWWVSVDDLTAALTMLEFETHHNPDKAEFAPAFATVRDIVESAVPSA